MARPREVKNKKKMKNKSTRERRRILWKKKRLKVENKGKTLDAEIHIVREEEISLFARRNTEHRGTLTLARQLYRTHWRVLLCLQRSFDFVFFY